MLYTGLDLRPVVYGLVDPVELDRIRYVGQTTHPYHRYIGHVLSRKQRAAGFLPVSRWIRNLYLNHNRVPTMVLLEAVTDEKGLRERERYWIRVLAAKSQADLNRSADKKGIVAVPYFVTSDSELSA